ncbi:hypothetical protein CROQUDRAFT_322378 [Cronartium quercuum f. sp. fusiforme G11]|uniref:Uncharacterized protein n=1 Tax=Cronartium quercuum f. sp. fusiforme G11 TaxID=708437 RepID=A0A9P6NB62_9BASI|nr:hypothetical protein CROQUDRAFT_322378 [Cronartium quercuum f. sp. fusiforme G11]
MKLISLTLLQRSNLIGFRFFFPDVIEKTIKFLCKSVQRQTQQKYVIDLKGRCAIKSFEMIWLGRHAFKRILSRAPPKFSKILRSLVRDLEIQEKRWLLRKNGTHDNLVKVVKSKSNGIFRGIQF